MSAKLMGEVYGVQLTNSQQSVALALADHGHDDGSNIYPSQGYVAWKVGKSVRQVRRILNELEALGLIIKVRAANHHKQAEYRMKIDAVPTKPPYKSRADKMSAQDKTERTSGASERTSPTHEGGHLRPQSGHSRPSGRTSRDVDRTFTTPERTSRALRADIAMSDKPSVTIKETFEDEPPENRVRTGEDSTRHRQIKELKARYQEDGMSSTEALREAIQTVNGHG